MAGKIAEENKELTKKVEEGGGGQDESQETSEQGGEQAEQQSEVQTSEPTKSLMQVSQSSQNFQKNYKGGQIGNTDPMIAYLTIKKHGH